MCHCDVVILSIYFSCHGYLLLNNYVQYHSASVEGPSYCCGIFKVQRCVISLQNKFIMPISVTSNNISEIGIYAVVFYIYLSCYLMHMYMHI